MRSSHTELAAGGRTLQLSVMTTTPPHVDELGTLFVGRQPILDRTLNTIGYELLFRGGAAVGSAEFVDGDVATARVR